MTAEVIELRAWMKELPPDVTSRSQRVRDRIYDVGQWLESKTLDKSPVVLIRRSKLTQQQVAAFELGREVGLPGRMGLRR